MFGYLVASVEDLSAAEKERYHAAYCGLCRTLGERCGQRCRLTLRYDLVFLVLLLSSLYEPPEQGGKKRCPPHPAKAHPYVCTEWTDYAADLSVALAYHKCVDDWRDDKSARARAAMAALAGPYRAVRQQQPQVCEAIEAAMDDIHTIEKRAARRDARGSSGDAPEGSSGGESGASDTFDTPDAAANRFGVLMGELFACRDDRWSDDVRRLGARLGKFVYVMDAAMDFEQDQESGSYNPLVALGMDSRTALESLELIMAGAAEAFERLPLEQDIHLLRSVVYAGVWQQYNARYREAADAVGEDGKTAADSAVFDAFSAETGLTSLMENTDDKDRHRG